MTHPKIMEHLADFAANELSNELSNQIRDHIEDCPDCTEWLETYRALKGATVNIPTEQERHPSSETLAQFALASESAHRDVKEAVTAHLKRCPQCDEELHLCLGAVSDASVTRATRIRRAGRPRVIPRADLARHTSSWAARLRSLAPTRLLLAACIVLSVVGGTVFVLLRATPDTFKLTRRSFSGVIKIEARRSIEANATVVGPGANVTLRAKRVALGAGFSVENGARLTIESNNE